MNKSVANKLLGPARVELPDYTVVDATGADAHGFLLRNFCNDLDETSASRAQRSGYCNPKGRLLAVFTIFAIDGGYRLVLHKELLEAISKRLQMFVLREDVKLTPRNDLNCHGFIVPTPSVFSDIQLPALPAVMDVKTDETGNWVQITETQLLHIASPNSANANEEIPLVDAKAWRLQLIHAGVPSLTAATVEQFIPQMINMQQTNGLCFTHGCYPGQEVVARLQYLGKQKRKMLRFSLSADSAPAAGTPIAAGDDDSAGVVVDAVLTDENVQLLAVMKLAAVDSPLTIEGQPLAKQALPYEL